MKSAINSIKEWFLRTLCHNESDSAQEPDVGIQEIILPISDAEPLPDFKEAGESGVEERAGETVELAINSLSAEGDDENINNVRFNEIESVTPLEIMHQKEEINFGQETDKQESGELGIVEQRSEVQTSEKAFNEPKLVSLTVDSIKYYDKLRSQMPTDDLKTILDDVCRNLIDNLIFSGCTPINEEPGCFDMSQHRVEPFQMVDDGTPYSKVIRKGVAFQNEVKLLAIVEL